MKDFFQKLFAKYLYQPEDVIFVKRYAITHKETSPILFKVAVTHRTLRGYVVVDADGFVYLIPFRHVIAKDESQ